MQWHAFESPVHDSQRMFRQLLSAMSEPGTLAAVSDITVRHILPPAGSAVGAAGWATLLTLCDLETSVWIAPELNTGGLADALTFHTGARMAPSAAEADFALVLPATLSGQAPAFREGSDTHPDRSTTLVVVLAELEADGPWCLSGPGIADVRNLDVGQGGEALMTRLAANRARFPRGLDAILTCEERLTAVPRSTCITQVQIEEGVSCMLP
ncbi:phosphonate C-P lyase system protein PhnH [Billgrantia kenyensis]|uniref:Phosphonate C-P lyase system protein PhnH n=1 Tax=Billgrantia kenyensis TaxID=321266 RepID=A0A7V9W1L6_9GAMM|nr:phosphonate C-P lyase system protein PhnH [Halomonas kenyensis]MBA2779342.1 phosphonate C-P lyase system protein PhnH [Halomonas kenyensis]MCG6662510.1 phosphonate C-P lyase system protein PhnH [Halomonas kenyensis]